MRVRIFVEVAVIGVLAVVWFFGFVYRSSKRAGRRLERRTRSHGQAGPACQAPKDSSDTKPAAPPAKLDLGPFDAKTATPLPAHPVTYGAAYVVDGDSMVIQKTQIRLFGVDAPELNHPNGIRAKRCLMAMCKGQSIRAEVLARDAHGRTVAICTLPDGRDLSAEMVKAGLALDWAKFSGGIYRDLEVPDARRKMWLADARQKGRMDVWARFEAKQAAKQTDANP